MSTRENESVQGASLAGVVCPAIEKVAAGMQIDPGLFTHGTWVRLTKTCGAEIFMHGSSFEDVHAMVTLLGASLAPFRVTHLGEEGDEPVIIVGFHNGAGAYAGGVEVSWYTDEPGASAALGLNLSALVEAHQG